MSPDDNRLTNIFADLEPGDFATAESFHQDAATGVAFETWVQHNLRMARYAFAAAQGVPQQVVVLASPTVERWYSVRTDETLGQFMTRVQDEARRLQATRMFTHRLVMGQWSTPDPDQVKTSSRSETALPGMVNTLYFYAITTEAQTGPEGHQRIHGGLTIDGGSFVGDVTYAYPQQVNDLYEILPQARQR